MSIIEIVGTIDFAPALNHGASRSGGIDGTETTLTDHRGSIIIAAQLPTDKWHDWIGEATVGDAIIDRLISGAHHIKLKGESMRKTRSKGR